MTKFKVIINVFSSQVTIDDAMGNQSVSITPGEEQVLYEFVLPADTRKVKALVEGEGSVLLALDYEYYVEQPPEMPAFNIDLKVATIQRLISFC